MKLKRIAVGMLTIGVAFALSGCGNNDDKRFLDALRHDTTTYTVNDDKTLPPLQRNSVNIWTPAPRPRTWPM